MQEGHAAGRAVALMYHALAAGGGVPAGQDPHYTLGAGAFERQLDAVARHGGGGSAQSWLRGGGHRLLITFDDGHLSNYEIALPALARRGMSADFFVNPAMVGRPGFASWAQLREMAGAGMSIQSHGYDHVYLTGLSPRALRSTLSAAREEISQRVGVATTLLAPPGGHMPHGMAAVARECGYTHVLSSRPGWIAGRGRGVVLPRMAVTAATGEAAFQRWLAADTRAILREGARYGGLALAKRLLGDDRYERMRHRALVLLRGQA